MSKSRVAFIAVVAFKLAQNCSSKLISAKCQKKKTTPHAATSALTSS